MNREQLIQEIVSGGFSQYEESGLIDHQSLRRWIKIELKRFGTNIMIGNEKTIRVKNGRAKLPENFWQLDLALRVDLDHIYGEGDKEEFLQSALFYKERREKDVVWDNESDSYQFSNFKCVEETIWLQKAKVTSYYSNPRLLRLAKGFKKEKASTKCHNLSKIYGRSATNEINITGDYINTNFNDGFIYLIFSGLETDDTGDLIIPEGNHDKISEYLIYNCRKRILEDIVTGNDDPNKITMLRYYQQQSDELKSDAMTDAKWFGAQGWRQAMKRQQWKDIMKQEALLPFK